ncbi:cytochrome c [Magnetospirillum sp. UT-4]|uniref:c-type cytochrome n=1 Tax=Magnetospirillum sp. UT-4 TaxID=2681467 RepID=UPI0013837C1F|nr:cytochrome c [Magnetospirillum sp. UT-4]CAA7612836.1 Cytochrome c' [Magnetospirillum sp. UT-4]
MRSWTTLALACALACSTAFAAADAAAQQKPEETLKMRQGLFQAVKTQFGPVGAFAQGKGDLPADAAMRAENLAALARILPSAFGKGSEALPGSNTKPEAFTSPDFAKGVEMLGTRATALAAAAKSGNADAIKAAAGEVGKTCKGCHDNFRKE